MIRGEKKDLCVRLYKEGGHTIQEIMELAGIGSPATVYRVLAREGITLRPRMAYQSTIVFDEEAAAIIDRVKPRNLSGWVCGLIKRYGVEE